MTKTSSTRPAAPAVVPAQPLAERIPLAFVRSQLLQECLAEREEIRRLKWIESEKAGCDIGESAAVIIWVRRHRDDWRAAFRQWRRAG